jgi:hypothetical protein
MTPIRYWLYCTCLSLLWLYVFVDFASTLVHRHQDHLPIHKTLYIGRNVFDDQINAISSAAIKWNQATKGQISFDIKMMPARINISNGIIINNVSPDFLDAILLDQTNENSTLAFMNDHGRIPVIGLVDERINESLIVPVVMHELGHAIGLEHAGSGTIMYPSISQESNDITKTDLEQLCDIYHCDIKQFE